MPEQDAHNDNRACVHFKGLSSITAAFLYPAFFAVVASLSVHLPCRCRPLGGGRERPPVFGPLGGALPGHRSLRTISGIDITCGIQGTYGFSEDVLPPIMPPGKKRIPLAPRGRIGTIGPDRIATTGPLSEPAIPVSPQAAGPAVPEREIGPGTGSGVLWHARALEMAACPAKLADSGGRTPSKAMAVSVPPP